MDGKEHKVGSYLQPAPPRAGFGGENPTGKIMNIKEVAVGAAILATFVFGALILTGKAQEAERDVMQLIESIK